ncbi:ER lumen protein retaining receptor, partial [Aulographum hederae CBS 113979]
FNIFRILGDFSHIASKIILIWAIHWNRSAEGVSLITQVLYAFVFVCRYLDLFWSRVDSLERFYIFFFKLFYIVSSLYIVYVMMRVYARTREREKAWKFGGVCFFGALAAAVPLAAMFKGFPKLAPFGFSFGQVLWTFSEILESVCVLPQLLLLRQTTVPTVIDSYYLVCLGSYRALYIMNWIYRLVRSGYFDPISVIFGVIQTALYVDFAWVYYTRQRVKLRAGGVVDSDDLNRGWLVGRVLGNKHINPDPDDDDADEAAPALGSRLDDEENQRPQNGRAKGWGARGISVSADEGVHSMDGAEDAQALADPASFEDDDDE